MKNLNALCAAILLMLALTVPICAGEMTTMIADPPPPPAAEGQIGTGAADGQIEIGVAGQIHTLKSVASPVDLVTDITLSLLHSLLPLL